MQSSIITNNFKMLYSVIKISWRIISGHCFFTLIRNHSDHFRRTQTVSIFFCRCFHLLRLSLASNSVYTFPFEISLWCPLLLLYCTLASHAFLIGKFSFIHPQYPRFTTIRKYLYINDIGYTGCINLCEMYLFQQLSERERLQFASRSSDCPWQANRNVKLANLRELASRD